MPKDCNGREIKVGDKVRHKHPPLDFDPGMAGKVMGRPEAAGFHNFQGVAIVHEVNQQSVTVRPYSRNQIPAYCSELVEVIT